MQREERKSAKFGSNEIDDTPTVEVMRLSSVDKDYSKNSIVNKSMKSSTQNTLKKQSTFASTKIFNLPFKKKYTGSLEPSFNRPLSIR